MLAHRSPSTGTQTGAQRLHTVSDTCPRRNLVCGASSVAVRSWNARATETQPPPVRSVLISRWHSRRRKHASAVVIGHARPDVLPTVVIGQHFDIWKSGKRCNGNCDQRSVCKFQIKLVRFAHVHQLDRALHEFSTPLQKTGQIFYFAHANQNIMQVSEL